MNLCSKKHSEVCYEDNDCPACELLEQIGELERNLDDAQKEIQELENNQT